MAPGIPNPLASLADRFSSAADDFAADLRSGNARAVVRAVSGIAAALGLALIGWAMVYMILVALPYFSQGMSVVRNTQRIVHWEATGLCSVTGSPISLGENGEPVKVVTLPGSIACKDLKPGDVVTLKARVSCDNDAMLYLTSTYAGYRVMVDGAEVASYGARGTYPSFMADPSPNAEVVHLTPDTGVKEVQIAYAMPRGQSSLRLGDVLVGSYDSLRATLFLDMGWMLFMSVIIVAMGIALVLTSLLSSSGDISTTMFRQLGLMSVCIGVWIFGETDLTALIFPRPAFLHVLTYTAFYCSCIPFMRLKRALASDGSSLPTSILLVGSVVFVAAALVLQALGVWQFSQSLPWYYVVCTLDYGYVTLKVFYDRVMHGANSTFEQFFLVSTITFDAFLILELANYYLWRLLPDMGFYMIGVIFFMVFNVVMASLYLRDAARAREREREAAGRLRLIESRVVSERRRYDEFAASRRELRRQRHDLRHQLAALRGFLDDGDVQGASAYVEQLGLRIPEGDRQVFCDEFAVDAVCAYYAQLAKDSGIESFEVKLGLPERLARSQEDDLCAIVGNMLENAVMAARECLEAGEEAFVHLTGYMHADLCMLTMDNGYHRVSEGEGGTFHTTKRGGSGIGLESVTACAQRNEGDARFEADAQRHVFRSSVYLRIREPEAGGGALMDPLTLSVGNGSRMGA